MKILRTLWQLLCFDKQSDECVADYELDGFDVERWRNIIGIDDDKIFQRSFSVLPEHLEFLQAYVPEPINLDSFDCFVEFCAIYDWDAKE